MQKTSTGPAGSVITMDYDLFSTAAGLLFLLSIGVLIGCYAIVSAHVATVEIEAETFKAAAKLGALEEQVMDLGMDANYLRWRVENECR